MKVDGSAVQYFLEREFGEVTGEGLQRRTAFDYPMLYDSSVDMRGHVVLLPAFERPEASAALEGALCVCLSDESAKAAREAGAAVARISCDLTFQHLYNRVQHVFVRNERFEARLRALVDTYAGFQPMLDACEATMGYPCALIDEQYRLVCQSSSGDDVARATGSSFAVEMLEPGSVDLFMGSRTYRRMRSSRKVFVIPGSDNLMMKNVFSRDKLVGSLVIEHRGDSPSARYARFVLDYLTPFVEEAYSRIGSFGMSSVGAGHVKAALQDLSAGRAGAIGDLEVALAESGHSPESDYVVLAVERTFTNEGAEERDYLVHRLELAWPYGYCFERREGLFMLVDTSEGPRGGGKGFAKELPLVARENLAKVGMSRPFAKMAQFDVALAQAGIALEYGSERDAMNWCYRFGDYALSWLLSRAVGDASPEVACHPAVTALARYDEAHETELLRTLSTFVRCRYNATRASAELFVARSTLLNRLERITELTGLDLEDPDGLLYLSLSLALQRG